jgi:hypothetical protein
MKSRKAQVHIFAARCPNGHRPPQTRTLSQLKDPSVRFYCRVCDQEFRPAADDRTRAVNFAEASEQWNTGTEADWTFTPPTAA